MLRHEPFLEEAARRGAAHPLGQDPLVGYLTLHAIDHAIQFEPESIPARHVADKVLTEVLLLPDESPCKKPYFWVADSVRRGASWETIGERMTMLADALEREGRYREAEDVFRTLVEIHELPGVAERAGEPCVVAAILGCARTLRKRAEFDLAEGSYAKGRERAHAAGLHDQEVSARVGAARLTIERGNYPKAQKMLDEIHRDFVGVNLCAHARGSIFHEMAQAIKHRDRDSAVRLLWEAYEAYEQWDDRERALYDVANELLEAAVYIPARQALEVLAGHCGPETFAFASGDLLDIAWRTRDRMLFSKVWTSVRPRLEEFRPLNQVVCYMYAGNAMRLFGRKDEGRRLLEEAQAIATAHNLNEYALEAEGYLLGTVEPEERIASPVYEPDDAIRSVVEGINSLWTAAASSPA